MEDSRVSKEEINDLIFKLQALLGECNPRSPVKASKVLEMTCEYIKKLQREVDEQCERLSRLLQAASAETGQEEKEEDILKSLPLQLQKL